MKKGFVFLIFTIVMFFSVTVFAGTQNYTTYENGDFSISCYISCTSNKGVGKTKGAPTGYYNRATVYICNSSGVSIGYEQKHGHQEAVASKTKSGKVYISRSYHLVADSSFNPVMPLYQQVSLSEDRY